MRLCSGNSYNYTITLSTIRFGDSDLYYEDKDGYPRGAYADHILKNMFLDIPEYGFHTMERSSETSKTSLTNHFN